jgi:hypothetical protein
MASLSVMDGGTPRAMTSAELTQLRYLVAGEKIAAATAGRAFSADDDGKIIPMSASGTMTIPSGLVNPPGFASWGCVVDMADGGTLVIQADAGVTLDGAVAGSVTIGQSPRCNLVAVQQVGSNSFVTIGAEDYLGAASEVSLPVFDASNRITGFIRDGLPYTIGYPTSTSIVITGNGVMQTITFDAFGNFSGKTASPV